MDRNGSTRRVTRRSSLVTDAAADAENLAPSNNRHAMAHASPKRALSSSSPHERTDMRKRARRKQKEREIKKQQLERRALQKRLDSIKQAAAKKILSMQAKHDTLQRKVAEATRLEDYDKAKIMNEQIRALRGRIKGMQADLQADPAKLEALLREDQDGADAATAVATTTAAPVAVPTPAPAASAAAAPAAGTPAMNEGGTATAQLPAAPVAAATSGPCNAAQAPTSMIFSPAPSQHGLAQPSTTKTHASQRKGRGATTAGASGVSTRRASFAGIHGSTRDADSPAPPTPRSLKMDQAIGGAGGAAAGAGGAVSSAAAMSDRFTPMAVPVVGYAHAHGPAHGHGPSHVDGMPAVDPHTTTAASTDDVGDVLSPSEAAVLEAAERIQARRQGKKKRAPSSTAKVDQACECAIM